MTQEPHAAVPRAPQAVMSAVERWAHIKLTPKERDLLAVLLGNPRRCLSRDVLLRALYAEERPRARAVDVHIVRLRQKLGPDHARAIKTIVRGGYCWDRET